MKSTWKKGERFAEKFNEKQRALMVPNLMAENLELRAIIKELIEIVVDEFKGISIDDECSHRKYNKYKSAIEKAKTQIK